MPRERYTTDRWEQLRPGFIRWAKVSGSLTALGVIAIIYIYGDDPILRVARSVRTLIVLFNGLVWAVFLITTGTLVGVWLIDRFGDRPGEEDKRVPQRNRGKNRCR
jgi:hypothetical protein